MHRASVVSLFARVDVEAPTQQQIQIRQLAGERRNVQQRVLVRLVASHELPWVRVEQRCKLASVTVLRQVEQSAFDGQSIYVRLERSPAREAILFRQLELRVGELGARVCLS